MSSKYALFHYSSRNLILPVLPEQTLFNVRGQLAPVVALQVDAFVGHRAQHLELEPVVADDPHDVRDEAVLGEALAVRKARRPVHAVEEALLGPRDRRPGLAQNLGVRVGGPLLAHAACLVGGLW